MFRAITSFRGEAPRVTPRALPDNAAQEATNANLLTGDLKAFHQFATEKQLANPTAPVRSIFFLKDKWLSWSAQVDAARGTVAGDTTYRTYLTGPTLYAQPRFTNYALATTGAEPFPVVTHPLGVPSPDSAPSTTVTLGPTPTTDVTDAGDQLATAWTISAQVTAGNTVSTVVQDAGVGNPAPSYRVQDRDNETAGAYAYRDFGVADATVVVFRSEFRMDVSGSGYTEAAFRAVCTAAGAGPIVKVGHILTTNYLLIGTSSEWGGAGSWLVQVPMIGLSGGTWYNVEITATKNSNGTTLVSARLLLGTTELYSGEVTSNFSTGGYCGIEGATNDSSGFTTYYDNLEVQSSGTTVAVLNEATSYVFTYVDDFGQESAPSPASATVLRPNGVTVTVSSPADLPSSFGSDYTILTKRIYRAATGNGGTVFRFVAEIPLAQQDYDDTLTDAELGEVLPSTLWSLPPADMEGILALPNGVMAGFSRNQLCLSAQNYPHAWPVEYRLNTDTDIVGIGNIDTTVVIGTESFVYVASGNDPAVYSMSKFEVPYACASKRSFAYLTGIGVVFAGPAGLMAVGGPGQVRNLTDTVFTIDQWKALNPSSIVAVAHNDIYWMFWDSGSERGCYAIDMKPTGFGVVRMAFHATAAYVDPLRDKMFLVLDWDDEPDDDLLPVPPSGFGSGGFDGKTIYEFQGDTGRLMTFRYRTKLWLLEYPAWFSMAQVRALDYDNLVLRVYADGELVDALAITAETEFTLAEVDAYTELEFELIGTSNTYLAQGAEDVTELR